MADNNHIEEEQIERLDFSWLHELESQAGGSKLSSLRPLTISQLTSLALPQVLELWGSGQRLTQSMDSLLFELEVISRRTAKSSVIGARMLRSTRRIRRLTASLRLEVERESRLITSKSRLRLLVSSSSGSVVTLG